MATTFNNSTEATCIYLQKVKLFKVLGINLLIFFFLPSSLIFIVWSQFCFFCLFVCLFYLFSARSVVDYNTVQWQESSSRMHQPCELLDPAQVTYSFLVPSCH